MSPFPRRFGLIQLAICIAPPLCVASPSVSRHHYTHIRRALARPPTCGLNLIAFGGHANRMADLDGSCSFRVSLYHALFLEWNGNPGPHCLWTFTTCSQKYRWGISHCRAYRSGRTLSHALAVIYYSVDCSHRLVLGALLGWPISHARRAPDGAPPRCANQIPAHCLRAHIRQIRVILSPR